MRDRVELEIWGREFNLEIVYDTYEGETVLPIQIETIEMLVNNSDIINNALDHVKSYCLNQYKDMVTESDLSNIFKYVVPKSIFVKRNEKQHVFSVMCHFKLDMEHGLAIVFVDNVFSNIGSEDVIL